MVLQRGPDHAQARAGAVALTVFSTVGFFQVVGGLDIKAVIAQASQHLPLIVEANLILNIQALAFDFGMAVAECGHRSSRAQVAVGVVQINRGCAQGFEEFRVATLTADFQTGQQAVLKAKGVKATFDLEVVEYVAGAHVLLPALTIDPVGDWVVAGQVGVFELTVEFEHAEGMTQLPVFAQLIAQA